MNLQDLKKPFQPREHKFNYENWAYIDEDAITTRLDDVCGIGNWQLITRSLEQVTTTHYICTVDLQIKIDGEWVTRSGVGEGTVQPRKEWSPGKDMRYDVNIGENAAKGAATDAFRRAARLWGIGRYLLQLPKTEYGKPTITNEAELRKWLIDNYKKDDNPPPPPPSPAPKTPPPSGGSVYNNTKEGKPASNGNSKSHQPARGVSNDEQTHSKTLKDNYNIFATNLYSDLEVIALDYYDGNPDEPFHMVGALRKIEQPESCTYEQAKQFILDYGAQRKAEKEAKQAEKQTDNNKQPSLDDVPF